MDTLRKIRSNRGFSSGRTVWALMMREMSTTYGRSVGGYAWVVLEPVVGIALLTVIFSFFLRQPPIGTNFAIFYATGMVPFMFYHSISGKTAQAVQFSKALLAYPGVTLADALIARVLLNSITGVLAGCIIFSFILLAYETRTSPQIIDILLSYLMAIVFGVGIGTINCFLFARFPDWQTVWSILNRPLLIISCVLFIFDNVPHPYDKILWWNPIVHIIGQMRKGFYVIGIGGLLWVSGLALLIIFHRKIVHEW